MNVSEPPSQILFVIPLFGFVSAKVGTDSDHGCCNLKLDVDGAGACDGPSCGPQSEGL